MFSILRRLWLRNTLWVFILVVVFILGITIGAANASPKDSSETPLNAHISVPTTIRATTTTTTTLPPTTTTVAPVTTKPQKSTAPAQPVSPTGDWVAQCHAWANEAGIVLNDSAIKLIDVESDCNPTIWNKAGSGAGGIPQALPASKMGCPMNYDSASATCQLRWMLNYVNQRYGDWDGALAHSNAKGWY